MARLAVKLEWHDVRLLRATRNGDVYADAEGAIWRKDPYANSGRRRADGPGRRAIANGWLQLGDDRSLALTSVGQRVLDAYEERREGTEDATKRCGTDNGYQLHFYRNEKPCEACRQAHTTYHRDRRASQPDLRKREAARNSARNRALVRLSKEYPDRFAEIYREEREATR